jgi:hypothetical protein
MWNAYEVHSREEKNYYYIKISMYIESKALVAFLSDIRRNILFHGKIIPVS